MGLEGPFLTSGLTLKGFYPLSSMSEQSSLSIPYSDVLSGIRILFLGWNILDTDELCFLSDLIFDILPTLIGLWSSFLLDAVLV